MKFGILFQSAYSFVGVFLSEANPGKIDTDATATAPTQWIAGIFRLPEAFTKGIEGPAADKVG